jgi:hypothetical protein
MKLRILRKEDVRGESDVDVRQHLVAELDATPMMMYQVLIIMARRFPATFIPHQTLEGVEDRLVRTVCALELHIQAVMIEDKDVLQGVTELE